MDFVLAGENLPFTVSLAILLCIGVIEGVGAIFGMGLSALLDAVTPDFDIDIDGPDLESSTTLSHFLSWLRFGKVPFLIIIVIFLTAFSISGLILQQLFLGITNYLLPGWVATIPALLISLPWVRLSTGILARFFPQDESEAVSEKAFIGRIATITLGAASQNSPAEARLTDEHGQSHYVMVEPDNIEEQFEANSQVLIVRKGW